MSQTTMYKYHRQKKIIFQVIFESKWFLVAIVIIFLLTVYSLVKVSLQRHQVNQEIVSLEQRAKELEEENLELDSLVEYLNSPFFGEKEGRLKLGLQKPGEKVVVITPAKGEESSGKAGEGKGEEKISNPQRWWNYFFGVRD